MQRRLLSPSLLLLLPLLLLLLLLLQDRPCRRRLCLLGCWCRLLPPHGTDGQRSLPVGLRPLLLLGRQLQLLGGLAAGAGRGPLLTARR